MSTPPKIVILCGGKMAFPAIQTLVLHGYLAGIATGGEDTEATIWLQTESLKSSLPFKSFPTKDSLYGLSDWLQELSAEVVLCICFPLKLTQAMLETKKLSFINFHTGPLPQYRGAMPLFEVLKNQERETVLTLHFMDADFDTGPVILKEPISIGEDETFGSLSYKMAERTGQSALNMAQMIEFGSTIPSHPQEETDAQYYPKPQGRDLLIRWELMQAAEIVALVQACNPWSGGADTFINGRNLKILVAKTGTHNHEVQPGTILALDATNGLQVAGIEQSYVSLEIISSELGISAGYRLKELGVVVGHRFLS